MKNSTRTIVTISAAVALIGGAIGGASWALQPQTVAPASEVVDVEQAPEIPALTDEQLADSQHAAELQQATIEANQKAAADAAAAQAAADAAAAQAAADAAAKANSKPAAGAPGSLVPFVASTDPNNANGGDYVDPGTYCQSGSASGNPPVCD